MLCLLKQQPLICLYQILSEGSSLPCMKQGTQHTGALGRTSPGPLLGACQPHVSIFYSIFRQRSWPTSTNQMLGNQKSVSTSGYSSGLFKDFTLQNGEISEDRSVGIQPLALDRPPDSFQRPQYQSEYCK